MKVFVYWNLHKHCWSIKALEGPDKGRVIAHAASWSVDRPIFKVSEAGRQRVLREQRKNVHAGVVGTLVDWRRVGGFGHLDVPSNSRPITYNPYKGPTFVTKDLGLPVNFANAAVAVGREVFAHNPRI